MKNDITVLDFWCGNRDTIRTHWSSVADFRTVRGSVSSRWKILAHSLGATIQDVLAQKTTIYGYDPFCLKEKQVLPVFDNAVIDINPDSLDIAPDIIFSCNPAPSVLDVRSSYGAYIAGLLEKSEKMEVGWKVFAQIVRAFIENFPDTWRETNDDEVYWNILYKWLKMQGFYVLHENCMLGLTLDRFWPLQSKLFYKRR